MAAKAAMSVAELSGGALRRLAKAIKPAEGKGVSAYVIMTTAAPYEVAGVATSLKAAQTRHATLTKSRQKSHEIVGPIADVVDPGDEDYSPSVHYYDCSTIPFIAESRSQSGPKRKEIVSITLTIKVKKGLDIVYVADNAVDAFLLTEEARKHWVT